MQKASVDGVSLTFMESCIARCVFYTTNEMQLIQCSLLLSALYMFQAVFRPSSGAYKTVCEALGIVTLSCCLPLVYVGCSNPSTSAQWLRYCATIRKVAGSIPACVIGIFH